MAKRKGQKTGRTRRANGRFGRKIRGSKKKSKS